MCFKDDKGFNYLKFLAAVQPVEKLEDKYSQRIAKLLSAKDSLKVGRNFEFCFKKVIL